MLDRIFESFGRPRDDKILQPFGGVSRVGVTVDFNAALKPTVCADAQHLPFKDKAFEMVLLDPPYDDTYVKHYSDLNQTIRRTKPKLSIYKALREAARVSSRYVILLHLVPCHIGREEWCRRASIGISTGPNKRIRCLTVFERI